MRAPGLALLAALVVTSGTARATDIPAGFRGEGDPKIETVFGDVAQFRGYVDRFFAVNAEMQKTRVEFQRGVQAVLLSLKADRKCPLDAVAAPYARAHRAGQAYHRLGKDLETQHASIRELDALGETSGLTPDYRWKVARALKLYPDALKDFREMKSSFQDQLGAEMKFRGCDPAALVARGEELEKVPARPKTATTAPTPASTETTVAAAVATFFIDNTSCSGALRVYVDQSLVGQVASSARAAFQTFAGRHEVCLMPASSRDACGAPGTVRQTYIHDGWSITLRCD